MKSFFDLKDILTNENASLDFLSDNELLASNVCEVCGHIGTIRKEKKLFRCTRKICRKQWSCLRGTFFANSRLPVHKVLFLSYHWIAGATHDYLCTVGGFASQTVTDFYAYLRQLVADSLDEEDCIIGGEGIVVELDESKFGKRKYNRGHRVFILHRLKGSGSSAV